MIKKTTSFKPLIPLNSGLAKALFVALILTVTAFTARSAEFTSFSYSASSTTAGDTNQYIFTYNIVTASPDLIFYAGLPTDNDSHWLIIDSVDVSINGTPAAIDAGASESSNRSLKIALSNPALATVGATIEVKAYVKNGQWEGNFSWNFIRTANTDGSIVDDVSNPDIIVMDPPIPANDPPYDPINITATSFYAYWDDVMYGDGYILEVSRNNIFTDYVTGYKNVDLGNALFQTVTGLSPNTTYYFRIRSYNETGISDYSYYRVATTTKLDQTINFADLDPVVYGAADFDLTATASSGLTVTYVSSDLDVATVTGTLVHIVGVGTTTITASQAGNSEYYLAADVMKDLEVTPLELTISDIDVNDKIYDGLDTATISTYGTLEGVLGADVVTINASAVSSKFADKKVGASKLVSITGITLDGADAANYSIGEQIDTADITIRSITLQRPDVVDRAYNGTTDAAISTVGILINLVAGDTVSVAEGVTATFADKNAADSIAATLSGVTLEGVDKDNYSLDSVYLAYGNISKVALTITAGDDSKVADGIAYSGGNGVVYEGFISGETPTVLTGTLSYGGTSQGATTAGTYTIVPQGLAAANYEITFVNGTLTITAKPPSGVYNITGVAPETYPNPFTDMIYMKNAENVSRISINNIVGQEVVNYINNGSSELSIPASELKQGIYIVVVTTIDGKHFTQKIVKK